MTVLAPADSLDRAEFQRGFKAMTPLWLGTCPFAFAFATLAVTSGLSGADTVAMTVLVFAGSAQLAIVGLIDDHTSTAAILLTVLLLNLRHVLYGFSLNRYFPEETHPPRPALAAVLTDESYGLTVRDYMDGRGSPGFYFGASVSIFIGFFLGMLAGIAFGTLVPNPGRLGLDFVFPLSFLALLIPLLRNRLDLLVAAISAGTAIVLSRHFNGGVTILTAALIAAGAGTAVKLRGQRA